MRAEAAVKCLAALHFLIRTEILFGFSCLLASDSHEAHCFVLSVKVFFDYMCFTVAR